MPRRSSSHAEAPGQDSFLDVVANLVGVLIILVMVVGTQARHAISSTVPEETNAEAKIASATQAANVDLQASVLALKDLQTKLQQEELEIQLRKRERDQALTLCSAAKAIIDQQKQKLSTEDRQEVELKTAVATTQQELDQLNQALIAAASANTKTEVLKHYPTPIAKTVFGQEVHFRLQDGRLTYVPFEEFVSMLKNDAPKRIWKLKDTDRVTETMGPVQGFQMRYTLKREEVAVPTGGGSVRQERAMLDQFVLLPTEENLGEPVASALAANSDFRSILRQYDPKRFTVTLWVYSESFQHFRSVRDELLKLGYITAGRPMPPGTPIGGSPEGSRSAAQ